MPSSIDVKIGRALARDIADRLTEFPGETQGDIAGLLGIGEPKLSAMKSGEQPLKVGQLVVLSRLGMTRVLHEVNELVHEKEKLSTASVAMERTRSLLKESAEAVGQMMKALEDGRLDKSETSACECELLDVIAAATKALQAVRGVQRSF